MKTQIRQLPISKRLRMNAAMVQEGARLADVGCDHAYCSIYLAAEGMIRHSIAMDVRPGPLARAAENISQYGVGELVSTRLSDGLTELQPGEADCILISGMGGNLMKEILERGMDCAKASRRLVLQPQSELMEFRQYLHSRGFRITAEDMCCEEGKYYTVMLAEYCMDAEQDSCEEGMLPSQKLQDMYGTFLLQKRHPVLQEYLQRELHKKEELMHKLETQGSERSRERKSELVSEIQQLQGLLGLWDENSME